jgi:hypothetical protein
MANRGINNTEVHKNTFEGGLNFDINIDNLQPNQYRNALNISIDSDGKFYAVKNLKGTTEVQQLFINTDASTPITADEQYNLLGVWAAYGFTTSDVIYPALVIVDAFLDSTSNYKLRVSTYNTQTDTFNVIFTKTIVDASSSDLLSAAGDAIIYSEAGKESLYFTDNYSGMYKVPIKVNSATPYTEEEVTLIRKYPLVERGLLPGTGSGGSLKCGSYQFAIRFIKKDLAKKTKWSLLSEPVVVSNDVNTSTELKNSTIGGSSGKQAYYYWSYDSTQLAEYDYAEIAVVEHVDGTSSPSQTSTIVGPVTIASIDTGSYLWYKHKSNSGVPYDLSEVVVDTAAIKTVSTLAVKNNRMLLGGITYHDLSYGSKPSVNNGNTQLIYKDLPLTTGTTGDQQNSVYKGYFRGEVYRFAVTFHDEFGNWSEPEVLDFSGVTENYISGAIDFKFPRRDYGTGTYTNKGFLFEDGGGNEDARALGLQMGIDNIPSWAKGMAILRAKRIKSIIAQTPIVPSILVQPAELTTGSGPDTYPTSFHDENGDRFPGATGEDEDAQPPNPLGTLMPKNFGHIYAKSIIRDRLGTNARVPDTACQYTGDTLLPGSSDGSSEHYQTVHVHFLYPPELILGDGNTKWDSLDDKQSYKLDVIDGALLSVKSELVSYSPTIPIGDFVESSLHLAFYAIDKNQYYYHDAQTTAIEATTEYNLTEVKHIDYNVESTLLTKPRKTSATSVTFNQENPTSSVMNFSSLKVTGATSEDEGFAPSAQEAFVCVTEELMNDITKTSFVGTGTGYTNTTAWLTGKITSALYDRHTNSLQTSGSSKSAIRIANIITNVDDLRYGEKEQYHEFYHTGLYKNVDGLSTTTVDVWGGDCQIGVFTFKLTDRTYAIPNSQYADGTTATDTDAEIRGKWDRHYDVDSASDNGGVPRPVGIKGNSQTITLVLESEISPNSINYNNDKTGFSTTYPFLRAGENSALDITIPHNYKCNMSSNIGNELKIWVPIDDTDRELTETKSRIAYSDQKIYNADIEGFDTYRALNFYDLDETLGAITKLITVGNNVFCVQEAAYSYIPIDSQVIETADATNLSVRSGEVIGIPNYINTNNGSQHVKTVIQTGDGFYFFDYKNKVLVKSVGGQEEIVSDKGIIDKFNDIYHDTYAKRGFEKNELVGIYDSKNRKYILTKRYFTDGTYGDVPQFAYVYDEKMGVWTTQWNVGGSTPTSILGGVTSKYGNLYLIGTQNGVTNPVQVSTMYTGNFGTFFGIAQSMYIDFVVNPMSDLPKTFDSIIVNSDSPLSAITLTVPLPSGLSYNTGSMSLNITDVENLYKLKTIRNITSIGGKTGQRMRGLYGEYVITFPTTEAKLNSVLTRYRPSNRGI